jgi:hypothetical protein
MCVYGMSCKSCVFKKEGQTVQGCRLNEVYRPEDATYMQMVCRIAQN